MLTTVAALTSKLQNQQITDTAAYIQTCPEECVKVRHQSEPKDKSPGTQNSPPKPAAVKLISFHPSLSPQRKSNESLLSQGVDQSSDSDEDATNPPMKRHCRSQSIPTEIELNRHWQLSGVHRPLPVRPHSGGAPPRPRGDSPTPRPTSALSDRAVFPPPVHKCASLKALSTFRDMCSAKSMPSVALPGSPRRSALPRCRSQPCVNQERRHAVKRRRDNDRPSINFCRMTESMKLSNRHVFHERVLQTIASSPQDPSYLHSVMAQREASPVSNYRDVSNARDSCDTHDSYETHDMSYCRNVCDTPDTTLSGVRRSPPLICDKLVESDEENVDINRNSTTTRSTVESQDDWVYVEASDSIFHMDNELDLDMIEND